MKTLIVYYSKTGNTEKVAKDLSSDLGTPTEKIIDKKKRTGIWGYITGGRDAMKKSLTEIDLPQNNPSEYDLVIVGMPVWGWTLVPAIRTYLEAHKTKIKNYAFFVTSGNTPAEKLTSHFIDVMNKEPLALTGFNDSELKDSDIYKNKMTEFVQKIRSL